MVELLVPQVVKVDHLVMVVELGILLKVMADARLLAMLVSKVEAGFRIIKVMVEEGVGHYLTWVEVLLGLLLLVVEAVVEQVMTKLFHALEEVVVKVGLYLVE